MSFNIFDVIQFGRKIVVNIHHDDFPVGLSLIEKSHDTENLDLFHLSHVTNLFPNLTDIQRVIVALCFGLGVSLGGILPGLETSIRDIICMLAQNKVDQPEGKRRSSKYIHGEGSSS